MALIQSLITSDRYEIKCPYAMNPKGLCIHNTANDAPAKNEISYMKSNDNEVSFHIAIDDIEAIQAIPFNRNAWASGDGGSGDGNRNYIHIEICYSKSGGNKFTEAEKRTAKEVASLLKQFGWGIGNIKKHQDFSNKYCPHRTLDVGWQRFLNMVQAELNGSKPETAPTGKLYRVRKNWADTSSQKGAYSSLDNAIVECKKHSGYSVFDWDGNKVYPQAPAPTPTPSSCDRELQRYSEKGRCTVNNADSIRFRNKPCTHCGAIQDSYYRNESVNYDLVVITERYVWISWTSASTGARRYMPIKDKKTGERWGNCV